MSKKETPKKKKEETLKKLQRVGLLVGVWSCMIKELELYGDGGMQIQSWIWKRVRRHMVVSLSLSLILCLSVCLSSLSLSLFLSFSLFLSLSLSQLSRLVNHTHIYTHICTHNNTESQRKRKTNTNQKHNNHRQQTIDYRRCTKVRNRKRKKQYTERA